MKFLKKLIKILLLIISILCEVLIIFIADYIVFDNNHINVVRQTVQIEGLPAQFDGFTILQVTDLHGKRFGNSQQELTNIINTLDYDVIAFTGDMQDLGTKDIQPFIELLIGIKNKRPMFYVSGNGGPFDILYKAYDAAYDGSTVEPYSIDVSNGSILPLGVLLQREGCTLLRKPQPIERGGFRIWFAAEFFPLQSMRMVNKAQQGLLKAQQDLLKTQDEQMTTEIQGEMAAMNMRIAYQKDLQQAYAAFKPGDTLIGIFHYPFSSQLLVDPQYLPPYDLIVAGHYHGGQFRLPNYGAIYIPDDSLPRRGLFPPQNLVSGLYIGKSAQQYVSRGLGASSRIPFLQFRLFDTPEINLITLRGSPAK